MAQSPNTMQEPSMDELLASIREIIEENAGAAPGENANRKIENEARAPRQPMETATPRPEIRPVPKNNSVPVQDAMNALAERIGLRKPIAGETTEAIAPRPVVAPPAPPLAPPAPPPALKVAPKEPKIEVPVQPQSQPQPVFPAPMQTQASPQPQVQPQPQPSQQVQSLSQVSPIPQVPQQPQVQTTVTPQPAFRQQQVNQPKPKPRVEIKRDVEAKKDMEELEKNFRADFEKSAELLLRPYIAQWLDEHFRHLFDKILREEIQRMVQSLRR